MVLVWETCVRNQYAREPGLLGDTYDTLEIASSFSEGFAMTEEGRRASLKEITSV